MKKVPFFSIVLLLLATGCRLASAPDLLTGTEQILVPPSEPTPVVPFSALEPYWSDWVGRSVPGPYTVYCKTSGDIIEYGVHFEQGQSMSFDSWGNAVPPTIEGGLITFQTDQCTYPWVNDIRISADVSLTLRISLDKGLVYQEGSGTVVLPNGDTLVFKAGAPAP